MEFSYRDDTTKRPILWGSLRSQSGQGTIEYVLVLVVGVAIIMGMLYQLNTAFKSWANNYFGDYLSCLLETGELPTIGGNPGDSGTCDQLFKAFSLAEGRPLKGPAKSAGEQQGGGGQSGAAREGRGRGGGGGYNPVRYGGGRFGSSFGKNGSGNTKIGTQVNTGNTNATDYGGGYSGFQPPRSKIRTKLDNKFAFEKDNEDQQKRKPLVTSKKSTDNENSRGAIKLKPNAFKRKTTEAESSSFTIGNFIRIIIIIGIILALALFIGGQVLSISKSME